MDTVGQLGLFFQCVAVGFVCGITYEPFAFLRRFFPLKRWKIWWGVCCDIAFFIAFATLYVGVGIMLSFPYYRFFMAIGAFIGLIIYLKTLHRILDFFVNVCYNAINRVVEKLVLRLRRKKNSQKREGKINTD